MPIQDIVNSQGEFVGILQARLTLEKGIRVMTRTVETVTEVVRNDKHPFRKTDNHPKKALKNRYERRKIKEFLNLTDWLSEEMA